jgi:hypothetical protein
VQDLRLKSNQSQALYQNDIFLSPMPKVEMNIKIGIIPDTVKRITAASNNLCLRYSKKY